MNLHGFTLWSGGYARGPSYLYTFKCVCPTCQISDEISAKTGSILSMRCCKCDGFLTITTLRAIKQTGVDAHDNPTFQLEI